MDTSLVKYVWYYGPRAFFGFFRQWFVEIYDVNNVEI